LPSFRQSLSDYAHRALTGLGVEVELGHAVTDCSEAGVRIGDRLLPAGTIIWAAGVAASPAAEWLHAPSDRAGRVLVAPDLTVPEHADIFVIGDTAHVEAADGKLVPGVAPAAKQEGYYVAETIKARISGRPLPPPFRYKDAGSLATIGKRAAIVDFGWLRLTGRLAWWMWGFAHIYFLIGLRNRLAVALSWLWIYISGQRSARLITMDDRDAADEP
jgi:NADH dehydrogenase